MPADVEPTYRIGEVTAQTTLSRDTLRYYERLGLLDHPPRTSGGFRMYGEATLERLRFIKRAQAVGFTLEEIRELVTFDGRGLTRCRRVRDLVQTKLAELDERLSGVAHLSPCAARLASRVRRRPEPPGRRGVPGGRAGSAWPRAPRRGALKREHAG